MAVEKRKLRLMHTYLSQIQHTTSFSSSDRFFFITEGKKFYFINTHLHRFFYFTISSHRLRSCISQTFVLFILIFQCYLTSEKVFFSSSFNYLYNNHVFVLLGQYSKPRFHTFFANIRLNIFLCCVHIYLIKTYRCLVVLK